MAFLKLVQQATAAAIAFTIRLGGDLIDDTAAGEEQKDCQDWTSWDGREEKLSAASLAATAAADIEADATQVITSFTGQKVVIDQREADRLEEARHGTIALTKSIASIITDVVPQAVTRHIEEPLDFKPCATVTKQKDVARRILATRFLFPRLAW